MRRLLLLAALAPAACERPAPEPAPAASAAPPEAAAPTAAPRAGPVGFVGRWGADPARCAEAQYVLTRTALEAPGGAFCSFRRVEETPAGWRMDAACQAREGGPRTDATLDVERIGDGLRLRLSGREPVTVRLCPENWAAAVPAPRPSALRQQADAIDSRIAAGRPVRPYEFKHQGVIHDAWRENDQVLRIVEADSTAWWFAPGAEEPFLVRRAAGEVGFERGRPLPGSQVTAEEADRLLARGRALRLAADG